jgi:hypothetical protein
MALTSAEQDLVKRLTGNLAGFAANNRKKAAYYEGQHRPINVGFNVPPKMRGEAPRLGWAGIVVDAVEERIQFRGWADPSETLDLDSVFGANRLSVEAGLAHLDALIYGAAFVKVGSGDLTHGEPDPLVTVESAMGTTGVWDERNRRLSAALTIDPAVKGEEATATLYLPDATISLVGAGSDVHEVSRDTHRLGRVPVVMLANRTSASSRLGHSEISASVRDLIDEGSRVLLAMAVNREFFSGPQRMALGLSPEDVEPWKAITGALWAIEPDEDGNLPEVKQFDQVSPGPHIDQLRALAVQLAAVSGVPETYFGGTATANPASADAIRANEIRLLKKAERRCAMFGAAWLEVARLALLIRDGAVPDVFTKVSVKWADPATPTRSAVADEITKYVGQGILPATSRVVLERIGLTPAEQLEVQAERAMQPPTIGDVLAQTLTRQTVPSTDTDTVGGALER